MKIYLLNPPFLRKFVRTGRWQGTVARGGELYYPIWLAYAAGVLEDAGFEVRLADAVAWNWDREAVLQDAARFGPDLLVVDSNFSSMRNDMEVARFFRENLEGVKTVMVGPPTSQFTREILQEPGVDIVARLEYDFTLRDVALALSHGKSLAQVDGISYREDGNIIHNRPRAFVASEELDSIPFVSRVYRKHLKIKDYFLSQALYPMVQIITGRGCPNFCTFCSWPDTLMGRDYRTRSISNVADELEYIKRELPQVREVFIEDDTFTIDRKRVLAFCDEVKKRGLKVTWSCNARANLDYDTMKAMKAAGCRLLDVGYESGSDEILKNIRKGISSDRMRRFAADARRAGLMVLGDFVIGFPGETRETAEQTIRFARELRPNVAQFAIITPIPGTAFYQWAKKEGFLLVDDLARSLDEHGFQKCIVSYPQFTDRDIEEYVDKALKKYYLSPAFIPVALSNIFRKDGLHELTGMIRSATVFLRYLARSRGSRPRNG